jgi:hypothetical protein
VWSLRRRIGIVLVLALAACGPLAYLAASAGAATTSFDRTRTILFNGSRHFRSSLAGTAAGQ